LNEIGVTKSSKIDIIAGFELAKSRWVIISRRLMMMNLRLSICPSSIVIIRNDIQHNIPAYLIQWVMPVSRNTFIHTVFLSIISSISSHDFPERMILVNTIISRMECDSFWLIWEGSWLKPWCSFSNRDREWSVLILAISQFVKWSLVAWVRSWIRLFTSFDTVTYKLRLWLLFSSGTRISRRISMKVGKAERWIVGFQNIHSLKPDSERF
jgi:hypothetical protein